MNSCLFLGEVYKKPEVKKTQNGVSFSRFVIKVYKPVGDGFCFVPVHAWREIADNKASQLDEGMQVLVQGEYDTSSDEKNGQKIYYHHFNARHLIPLVELNDSKSLVNELDFPF